MHRDRTVRLLSCWVFVAALLLKSAVPMLASAAAGLQGKPVAEICDVYGVDMSMKGSAPAAATGTPSHDDAHARHDHAHAGHGDAPDSTAVASVAAAEEPDRDETPPSHRSTRTGHGGEHCVLSALAFAPALDAAAVAPARRASLSASPRRADSRVAIDPAARWAAQLQHGPPASA